MNEQAIYSAFEASSQNCDARVLAVNTLRHCLMDSIIFDNSNDNIYMAVYERVMQLIESRYPSLSWEVQRQIAKKKRRQERKINEQQQRPIGVHI